MTTPVPRPGRLPEPLLDDRRWDDLVREALDLVPRYAPQWTDRNASDLGVTLVELFAWLVEGLVYKLNRVPEKNYVAFLDLLGVTRSPMLPARTVLTFTTRAATTVPAGTLAQTPATEAAPAVTFETETDLAVVPLPVSAAVRIDRPPADTATCTDLGAVLAVPGGGAVDLDLAPGAGAQVCLGFTGTVGGPVDVYVELSRLEPPGAPFDVAWTYSAAGAADPAAWPAAPVTGGRGAGLRGDGLARVTPSGAGAWARQAPSTWGIPSTGPAPSTTASHWIGLRVTNTATATATQEGRLRLGLARLAVNSVPASSTRTVPPGSERVGVSTGAPFQTFRLRNAPVHRLPGTDTPFSHLTVTVDGAPWSLVDDLADGPGTQYLLDPVRAEITFGDRTAGAARGSGLVPPAGAVVAAGYRYVATGAAANVPAGAVAAFGTPVAGVVAVTNPGPGRHGRDEEPVEETKRRAPEVLRVRDRAVTAEDFERLARAAAPGVASARCLPPRAHADDEPWTYGGLLRDPGNVTVVVVPDADVDDPTPTASPALLQDVRRELGRRVDVATRLHVCGPLYLPVRVTAELRVFKRAVEQGLVLGVQQAQEDLRRRVRHFLHPVRGGRGGRGWEVGQSVFLSDVYEAVRPPADVGYLADLKLQAQAPLYPPGPEAFGEDDRPSALGAPGPLVQVLDYELVCAAEPEIPEPEEE